MDKLTKHEQLLSDKLRAVNIEKDTNIDVDAIDQHYLDKLRKEDPNFISRRLFATMWYDVFLKQMQAGKDPLQYDTVTIDKRENGGC